MRHRESHRVSYTHWQSDGSSLETIQAEDHRLIWGTIATNLMFSLGLDQARKWVLNVQNRLVAAQRTITTTMHYTGYVCQELSYISWRRLNRQLMDEAKALLLCRLVNRLKDSDHFSKRKNPRQENKPSPFEIRCCYSKHIST